MCRQFPHRAPTPDARPARRGRPDDDARPGDGVRPGRPGGVDGGGRRSRIGRPTAVLLATWLLTGLGAPPVAAQQTPDSWSADRRAVLPSGLGIQFDYAAVPGVTVTPATGKLDARPGADGSPYSDGIRPGDPAETFLAAERRPRADGSWHTLGTLQLTFSRPVRNPRLHVSGLTAVATSKDGTTTTSARLTVTGGSPAAPALVGRTGWPGWTVGSGQLAPAGAPEQDGADGTGTLELAGTVTTVALRVEQRVTAKDGSTTPPAALKQAWTVTLDEGLGSAPQGYGNASHLISDLFLGQDAASASRTRAGLAQTVQDPLRPGPPDPPPPPPADAGPVAPSVELDGGEGRRSPWASPPPPLLQPGRAEYQGADPTLVFPTEAAVGRSYHLDVPVAPGGTPAVLAGWIDFDHNGRFDPLERVQAEVPAGASTAALEWQVPPGAAGGETWVRLRLARSGPQLVTSGGFADSGQVVDQKIGFAVGTAKPEVALPVPGTVTREPRPEFRGDGALPGASIAVQENGTTLCTGKAGNDGSWNCRPDRPLAEGAHTLVAVETTRSGTVLRGDPFRLTVRTTPPTAPVLTLPAFTNDPGLLLTGLGEPGSTVTVSADAPGRAATDLCSTGVTADGTWSCLPVENLPDGRYRLVPRALDGAGNSAEGKPVTLTVDTVLPDRPRLTTPGPGETLHTGRPRLAGRAEPGTTVTVTASHGDERTTVCSAVTAPDGTWACTATHDLAPGDLTLLPTATDPAGNGTQGEPVAVHLLAPNSSDVPSPTPSAPPTAADSPTAPASPSATPSTSTPAPSPSASASPSAPAPSSPSAVPSASPSAVAAPSPSSDVPVVPIVVPTPAGDAGPSVSPSPSPSVAPSASAPVTASPSGSVSDPASASASASATPAPAPSAVPSASPSASPSPSPSSDVPVVPIVVPTPAGDGSASPGPSVSPSSSPAPSVAPSASAPATASPSASSLPSAVPPSASPSPSLSPSSDVLVVPIVVPTPVDGGLASSSPSAVPSASVSAATGSPGASPVASVSPSVAPSVLTSSAPSVVPSAVTPSASDASASPAASVEPEVTSSVPPELLAVMVPALTVGQEVVPAPSPSRPQAPVTPSPLVSTAAAPAAPVVPAAPTGPAAAAPTASGVPAVPGVPVAPAVPVVPAAPAAPAPSEAVTILTAPDAPPSIAVLPPDGTSAPAGAAEAPAAEGGAGSAKAFVAPPPDAVEAAHRAAATGWRGMACGALLVAAALGLLARRVFGRGSGRRRR
ncbi:Ig-like domain-containing protein [Kitasatospora sp. NPDC088134]|uniref:Ig-like domain-containing protein n=1 Tax=Kitasatospora sp. NPDC088134 TaxID=3364071 RepID=UPI00382D73F4